MADKPKPLRDQPDQWKLTPAEWEKVQRDMEQLRAHGIVPPYDPDTAAVHLPVFCAHCGGAVTLQFANWKPEDTPVVPQTWPCPYCAAENMGGFPGRVAWAVKGHDDRRPV